jgi:putative hydrolase of the HAD superfamily
MKIVFDFGGVLFSWHPVAMLQREIPHVAHNAAEAVHWVAQIFQGYTGDWGDFDRGTVQIPSWCSASPRAPAWPRPTCRPWWTA